MMRKSNDPLEALQGFVFLCLVALCWLVFASSHLQHKVYAQGSPNAVKYTGAQHAVSIPFGALSATGTTPWVWVGDTGPTKHAVQVDTTGSPGSCTYNLEGSLDGTNAQAIISSQACTTSGTLTWATASPAGALPVMWVRINITALSSNSTATPYYFGSM